MPDTAVTANVFLDTEVFDAQFLDFASPNIRRLARLASQMTINLVLTTVTTGEVRAHLEEKATEAVRAIKAFGKQARSMRKLLPQGMTEAIAAAGADEEKSQAVLKDEFEAFLKETCAHVLPIGAVGPEEILQKYFAGTAPFGLGRKKDEFPDAFAFAAIHAWVNQNTDQKLYLVSNDPDWKRACEGNANLLHVHKLEELLQLFADSVLVSAMVEAVSAQQEEVKEFIQEAAGTLSYFPGDDYPDADIDDFQVDKVEIGELHVTEAKDGKAAVSAICKLSVSAFVKAGDPKSAVYNKETGNLHYFYYFSGHVEREYSRVVEIGLLYEKKHPEKATIAEVTFEIPEFDLGVEEGELPEDDHDSEAHDDIRNL